MKISIYDLIGDVCMTYEDGDQVYAAFHEAFDLGETVELDFAKTRIFVSAFFNASVGRLLEHHTRDEVRERLIFSNLPPSAAEPLRRSVENADRYYHDPAYRESLDRVLENLAVEA